MSSGYEFLSVPDLARYFAEDNAVRPDESPVDVAPRVSAWLEKRGLGHRDRDAFGIAIAAIKSAKLAPLPTPEEAAWRQNQMDGIGNAPPLSDDALDAALAARVQNMSLAEFARERSSLGVHKDTYTFLSGGN